MGKGCPRTFDPELYRRPNVIERCVGWLKGCRSAATRHEKLAVNFAAMVQLAFLRQYLWTLSPSDTAKVRPNRVALQLTGRRCKRD